MLWKTQKKQIDTLQTTINTLKDDASSNEERLALALRRKFDFEKKTQKELVQAKKQAQEKMEIMKKDERIQEEKMLILQNSVESMKEEQEERMKVLEIQHKETRTMEVNNAIATETKHLRETYEKKLVDMEEEHANELHEQLQVCETCICFLFSFISQ